MMRDGREMNFQYLRVARARISYRWERPGSTRLSDRLTFQPFISERCRSSTSWQVVKNDSSTSHTIEALEPRSLPDSECVRVRLGAGLGACGAADDVVLVSEEALVNGRLARIVPPFVSQSSSSSAISANTSGSSSSTVEIQHMRVGSKTMLPTLRAPEAKEPKPTGEPIDEPVKCVISAGRVDVPTAASNSLRA